MGPSMPCFNGSGCQWSCNDVGDLSLAHSDLSVPNEHHLNITAHPSVFAEYAHSVINGCANHLLQRERYAMSKNYLKMSS